MFKHKNTPNRVWVQLAIEGAAHGQGASVEDVGVDHGCPHVLMSEEFLHGSDIVAIFKEVRGEAMAEGVAGHALVDPRPASGFFDGLLETALADVMAADRTRSRVLR